MRVVTSDAPCTNVTVAKNHDPNVNPLQIQHTRPKTTGRKTGARDPLEDDNDGFEWLLPSAENEDSLQFKMQRTVILTPRPNTITGEIPIIERYGLLEQAAAQLAATERGCVQTCR